MSGDSGDADQEAERERQEQEYHYAELGLDEAIRVFGIPEVLRLIGERVELKPPAPARALGTDEEPF